MPAKSPRYSRFIAMALVFGLWVLLASPASTRVVDGLPSRPAEPRLSSEILEATIHVSAQEILGPVNRLVFGNAVLPAGQGNGLLDRVGEYEFQFDPVALEMVRDLKPSVLRFGKQAFFEDAIGPQTARHGPRCGWPDWATFEFGTDEHLAFLDAIGAPGQAVILVGYPIALADSTDPNSCVIEGRQANLSQMVKRAMAWVAYANSDPQDPTTIGVDDHGFDWGTVGDWAQKRVANGHPEPYGIRYWEIGNEVYLLDGSPLTPEEYARDYLVFREAMHRVDPTITIGVEARVSEEYDRTWNEPLLTILGDNIDAVILHIYYPFIPYSPAHDLALVAAAQQADKDMARIHRLIAQTVSQPDEVCLLITESGVHLGPEDAVTWNRLLVGVYDADLLGLYVERSSSYHIDLAVQHWLHGQSPTADINYDWATGERYRRPDYYALQMWTQHFGGALISNTVASPTFDLPEQHGRVKPTYDIPYLSVHTSLGGDKLYLLVINRHLTDTITTTVHIAGFYPKADADVYTLNGQSYNATNESGSHDTVVITHTMISNAGKDLAVAFPAHSVTAIELSEAAPRVYLPRVSR
jgi:alpha-N-arabinofuranosidase